MKILTYVTDYQVILTRRCASACGYCNFPSTPSVLPPSRKQLRRMLRQATRMGARQISLTSGEGIDELPEIVSACRYYGFRSWHDYLRNMCRLILQHCDSQLLFPQLDVGSIPTAELPKLRSAAPVVRLMLHSADESLLRKLAHSNAPTKAPSCRISALEELGRCRVPTVTGLTIGIGESPASWGRAARLASELQRRYHHIQAFMLRPFFPMPFSPMAQHPPVSDETFLSAVYEVRKELDESIPLGAELQNRIPLIAPAVHAGVADLGPVRLATSERIDFDLPHTLEQLRLELQGGSVQLCERMPFMNSDSLKHSTLFGKQLNMRSLHRLAGGIYIPRKMLAC